MLAPPKLKHGLRSAAALAAAAGLWAVGQWLIAPGVDVDGMARGVIGPATWPRAMLYGAAACAVVIFLRQFFSGAGARAAGSAGEYHEGRSLFAVGLLVAYGAALPLAGMAWATAAFLAAWLALGGVRRPLTFVLVPLLGTIAVLYLFVKVSLMPLERGRGAFEQATVALYRLLGIY
jgi:putative tricarboxylic transport membrane protein